MAESTSTNASPSAPSAPAGSTETTTGGSEYPQIQTISMIAYGTPAVETTTTTVPPMQHVTYGSTTGACEGGGDASTIFPPRMSSSDMCCGNRVVDSGISSLYNDENEFTIVEGRCGSLLIDLRMAVTPNGTGKVSVDTCCTDIKVIHSPYQHVQRTGATCCTSQFPHRDMRKREMKAMGLPPVQSNIIVDSDSACGNAYIYTFDIGQEINTCSCFGI